MFLLQEAEKCRREAAAFRGKPEAPFLLNIARAFEELASRGQSSATAAARREVNTH